jgi:co-chaperonin GroES (HSP10)
MSIAEQQFNAARENNGLANIESYKDCPLPEDYDVVELLGDIIQVEYADVAEDGKSLVRNGIILPNEVVDQKAWRIGKVILVGPDARQVKKGQHVMFPGDKGLIAVQKGGKTIVFLDEKRIFGIVKASK